MKNFHFFNLYKISLRFPVVVLFSCMLLAFAGAYFSIKLKIETDFSAMLPPDKPSVRNLATLKEYFGGLGHLYLTVEHPDPALAEQFADKFVADVENLPMVRFVDFRRPHDFFKKRKWFFLELEDLKEMERRIDRSLELGKKGISPVFSGLMDFADKEDRPDLTFEDIQKKYDEKWGEVATEFEKGEEGRLLIIRVKSFKGSADLEANRVLISGIQDIEKNLLRNSAYRGVQVGYSGAYMNSLETTDLVRHEMAWVSGIVGALLLLILVGYFKRASGAVLVGLPLVMGVLWTGGMVELILGRVNILTAFGLSILAGLGSDYGIYLLARFFKEIDPKGDFDRACYQAFAVTGKATFMAVLTTMAAFGALLFSGFDVFVEFGVVGFVGLLLNYLAMIIAMPALLALARKYPNSRWVQWLVGWKHRKDWIPWEASPVVVKIFRPSRPRVVILATLALIVLASQTLPAVSKIYFEEGQLDYRNLPANKLFRRISDSLKTNLQPTAVIVKGQENESKLAESFQAEIEKQPKEKLGFDRVLSVSSFIPKNQEEKSEILARMIPKYLKNRFVNEVQKEKFILSVRENLAAGFVTLENLPKEIRRIFISPKDPSVFSIFVFSCIDRQTNEGVRAYNASVNAVPRTAGIPAQPVDGSFINADLLDIIEREAPRGFLFILIFLFLILFLSLKSLKRSLLILVHLLGAMVILSGVLYLTGIRLNILNIAVFPIILGTGIDCFIHFSHHFDESGDLLETIRTDIPPILVSNLTSIIGFAGLIFTSGYGLQVLGWVAVLGLTLMSLFCVFIFPRVLSLRALAGIRLFPRINPIKPGLNPE